MFCRRQGNVLQLARILQLLNPSVGLLSWTLWLDFEHHLCGLKCNDFECIQTLIWEDTLSCKSPGILDLFSDYRPHWYVCALNLSIWAIWTSIVQTLLSVDQPWKSDSLFCTDNLSPQSLLPFIFKAVNCRWIVDPGDVVHDLWWFMNI